MSFHEDLAAAASHGSVHETDAGAAHRHQRKGGTHRRSMMHANLAESLKIRQVGSLHS